VNRFIEFPSGDQWFTIDQHTGTEIIDIFVLDKPKQDMNQLAASMESSVPSTVYDKIDTLNLDLQDIHAVNSKKEESTVTLSNHKHVTYSFARMLNLEKDFRKKLTLNHQPAFTE